MLLMLLGALGIGKSSAQNYIDGYVFESNNRGYLNQVKVTAYELPGNIVVGEAETGPDGHFLFNLPAGNYRVLAAKDIFFERFDTVNLGKEKVFLKMELRRRPGYLFDATIAEVRESGFTRTMFGRIRSIPDMDSKNPNARGFAERTAVNTPLQGTAADLIKLAMIRIDRAIAGKGLAARMLLQVHDELVFEVPPEERDKVTELVKREMENVAELRVPLVVEVGVGPNWRDAK